MDHKGTTNADPVNDIQNEISRSPRYANEDNIFQNRKMTEHMASRWMTVGGWIQESKAIRKDAVKMGGSKLGTTWGDITKEGEEMQIEALKRLTRS